MTCKTWKFVKKYKSKKEQCREILALKRTATVERKCHGDYGDNNQQLGFLKWKFRQAMSIYLNKGYMLIRRER